MFTKQRLALLQTLGDKRFESVRKLANHLGRDVHNVYEDLQLFRKLGLVDFDRGPRNSRIPRLLADSINVIQGHSNPKAKRSCGLNRSWGLRFPTLEASGT